MEVQFLHGLLNINNMIIKKLPTGVVTIINKYGRVTVFTEKQYKQYQEVESWWIKIKDKLFK